MRGSGTIPRSQSTPTFVVLAPVYRELGSDGSQNVNTRFCHELPPACLSGTFPAFVSVQKTEITLGWGQRLHGAVNDRIGIEPAQ